MAKSAVLRFFKYDVFQKRGNIREKTWCSYREKVNCKLKKTGKQWAFWAVSFWAYESSFGVNGGVLNPFEVEAPTLTMELQQIIPLKTMKSKVYVATPCAGLITAISIVSFIVMKVPYQSRLQILV